MAKHTGRGSSLIPARGFFYRGPAHRQSVWAGALSIFLLLVIIAIRLLGDRLYHYPPNREPQAIPKDSVIVCLAGGKHRIETAYRLFASGVGEKLWIIGAGKKSTVMGLARAQAIEVAQQIPWDRIDKIQVETESRNTLENAYAVKRLLEQNPGVKSLVLVTSSYHMRRAALMISYNIPPDVGLMPYTPESTDIELANWWHTWPGISLTTVEYVKLLLVALLLPGLGYF